MRLRHVLIGIGVLVGIAVLALAVFVATFDANRYKSTLIELVEKHTGRALTIDGELSLALLPRIGLSVGQAQLSGPKGKGEFAQIDSARIGVAVWPLLSKQVQVERVSLDGLKLDAIRYRDGSTNFDDLVAEPGPQAAPEAAPATESSPADAASAAAASVTIAQLQLTNSALGWRDESSDAEWLLQDLDLDADRIASGEPGKLRIAGRLIGKSPRVSAQLGLTSGYRADFATSTVTLSDLKFDLRTDDGIEGSIAAPLLTIADGAAEGKPVEVRAQVRREELNVDATLGIAMPSRSGQQLAFGEITANVVATGKSLPANGVKLALTGNGTLDTQRETASLTLRGTLDESPLQARATATRFSPPSLQYELQADQIDIDRYAGIGASAPGTPEAGSEAPASGSPDTGAADAPIPVPPIAGVDTSGSVRIGLLQAAGVGARDVAATIRSGNGRIEVTRLAAGVYSGSLTGSGALGANGRHALKLQMNGIDIGMALRDLAGRDALEGRGNLGIDVTANGMTVPALERSLGGSARLALRDGAIQGIDLNKVVEQVSGALATLRGGAPALEQQGGSGEKTAFASLDASFSIRNGVARSSDLDMRSPLLRVGGEGTIDIPAGTVDYLMNVALVGTLAGQGGAALSQLRGVTIPVRVSGPFASLAYRVDMENLARGAIKRGLTRQLEERLLGKPESGGDGGTAAKPSKPTDPRELLRGLLRK